MSLLDAIHSDLADMLVALLLGSAIGLEREASDKSAGLRTNILICMGAALFTLLSKKFAQDPARIAAQIVTGIGFLGAGSIMRDGERVSGLTTAATIWLVAAIGTAVGFGHHVLAAITTVLVLAVQIGFTKVDIWIDDLRERHDYRIVTREDEAAISLAEEVFRRNRIRVMRRKLMKKEGHYFSEWSTIGPRMANEKALKALLDSGKFLEVSY